MAKRKPYTLGGAGRSSTSSGSDHFGVPNVRGGSGRLGGIPNVGRGSSGFGGIPNRGPSHPHAPTPSPAQTANAQHTITRAANPVVGLTGGRSVRSAAGGVATLNVKGLQQQLLKAGYKIKVDGVLGPQTLSALRDYYGQPNESASKFEQSLTDPQYVSKAGGVGHPNMWDSTHVGVHAPVNHATTNPDGTPGAGETTAGTSTDTSVPAGGSGGTVDLSSLYNTLTDGAGTPISTKLANFGSMTPMSAASAAAQAQYGPQIAAAKLSVEEDPIQAAQDLKDIASWYGQVGAAQRTAGQSLHDASSSATGSIGDAAAALVASLGGGANAGAGNVAAAGQNAAGTISAENNATNQYESEIGPLLTAEAAEQKVNQQNKNNAQALSDKSALTALQGAEGSATTANESQIRQENNSLAQARAQMTEQILGNNNALSQQNFSNQMALTNAQIAAMINGLNAQYKQAQTQATINKATTNNPQFKANHPFMTSTPSERAGVEKLAAGSLVDSTGKKLNISPQQALKIVQGVYGGQGYNPVPGTPSYNAAVNVVKTWQAMP